VQFDLFISQQRAKNGRDRGLIRFGVSSANADSPRYTGSASLILDLDPNDPNLEKAKSLLLGQLLNLLLQVDEGGGADSEALVLGADTVLTQFAGGEA
jgi:hypothetical protein